MNKHVLIAALAAAAAAAPGAAATYDAFASFNGVNGNNHFTYGYTDGTTLTAFDTSGTGSSCVFGPGSTCLTSSANGQLPVASIHGSYPTVTVPTDMVVIHPGNSAALSNYVGFVATSAGNYSYTIDLQSVGIDTTNGTGYTPFTSVGGVVALGTRALLPTYLSTGTLGGTASLVAGETFGIVLDYNGIYYGDSTGIDFTVAGVPEPASWALMIAGFGMVGFAARRRQPSVAA